MESVFNPQCEADIYDPKITSEVKNGANWFYWIAALSLINSAIFAFGGDVNFIAGLAVTLVVDGIAEASVAEGGPAAITAVAIVIDLIFAALFALFGYYANKAVSWAFIAGIAVYVLDAVLYLVLDSFIGFGFHVFALIFIVRGFLASRRLQAV